MEKLKLCPFIKESSMTNGHSNDIYFYQIHCIREGCMAWGYVNNERDIEGCKLIERQILTVQIK